jgi:FtsZ-binding cell division protein ZapB
LKRRECQATEFDIYGNNILQESGVSQAAVDNPETDVQQPIALDEPPAEASDGLRNVLGQFREEWDQIGVEFRERQEQCVSALVALCERLYERHQQQRQALHALELESAPVREERDRLASEEAQWREQRDHLDAESTELREQRDQLAAESAELREQRDQLAAESAELREQRDQLVAESAESREQRDQLAAAASQCRKERDQLATALAQLTAVLQDREQSLAGPVGPTDQPQDHRGRSSVETVVPVEQPEDASDTGSPDAVEQVDQPAEERDNSSVEAADPIEQSQDERDEWFSELAGQSDVLEDHRDGGASEEASRNEVPDDSSTTPQSATRVSGEQAHGDQKGDEPPETDPVTNAPSQPKHGGPIPRCFQGARVTVIPDNDRNQTGIDASLHDLSCTSVSLILRKRQRVDEYVVIEMESANHRVHVRVRAVVRQVEPIEEGCYLVGFTLITQLEFGEVVALRSN